MNITKYKHEFEFLALLIAFFLIWYLGRYFHIDTEALQKALQKFPLFYGALLYIILYVVVTFFVFFSKDVFWLIGAILFRPVLSTVFICIAETINAFILFFLARRFGRGYVEKSVAEKYKYLDDKLGHIGFFWFFIFRAAPLIPYRFLDIAAGLTKIPFSRYLAAVVLGSPVKMFWLQYILFGVGKSMLDNPYILVEYFLQNRTLLMFSFLYLSLVIMAAWKLKPKH